MYLTIEDLQPNINYYKLVTTEVVSWAGRDLDVQYSYLQQQQTSMNS